MALTSTTNGVKGLRATPPCLTRHHIHGALLGRRGQAAASALLQLLGMQAPQVSVATPFLFARVTGCFGVPCDMLEYLHP